MIRPLLIMATLGSLLWLPWPFTVVLMFVASVSVPVVGVFFGVLAEILYGAPGSSHVPVALLTGLAASGVGFFAERFIHARIATS